MRRKDKRGDASTLYVTFGVIAAVVIFAIIFSACSKLLKAPDVSKQRFENLGRTIDEMSKGGDLLAESELIHLEPQQMILFFDKGDSAIVQLRHEPDELEKYVLPYNSFLLTGDGGESQITFLNTLLEDRNNYVKSKPGRVELNKDGVYIYRKPQSCHSNACIVLCNAPYTVSKLENSLKASFFAKNLNDGVDIKKDLDPFFVIECTFTNHIEFEEVNNFYRKPFVSSISEIIVDTTGLGAIVSTFQARGPLVTYYNGFVAYHTTNVADFIDSEFDGKTSASIKKDLEKLENKPFFTEDLFSADAKSLSMIKDMFLRLHKVDDSIVACYQSPCLNWREEKYFNFRPILRSCLLDGSTCDQIYYDLNDNWLLKTNGNLVIIDNQQGKLRFSYSIAQDGEVYSYAFTYDYNAKLLSGIDGSEVSSTTLRVIDKKLYLVKGRDSYQLVGLDYFTWADVNAQTTKTYTEPIMTFLFVEA